MSFITIIRDYIEFLNHLSESLSDGVSVLVFLKETSIYFFKTIQYIFLYTISFQWLRDFTLLPITIPQISSSLIREHFVLENTPISFFSFLEVPNLRQNTFILGFFNSFFLIIPFSIVHILTIRRLFIKGIPAAVFSIFGYIFGEITFISCVIFGFRNIIIPWFSLEPLNYLLGLFVIFRLVYTMTQENLRELPGWNQPQYKNFFLTNFFLAWCEQTAVFQYLGNINLSATSSILEINSFSSPLQIFFEHSSYIVGLLIGCFFFIFFWGVLLLNIKNLFIRYTPLFLSNFIQTLNTGSLIIAVAFSLSSVPFYGLDYLTTGPLGFVSQDKIFKNTVFDSYNIKDSVVGLGISSQFASVDIDVSPFDRGRYLLFPERTLPFDFEDLNYKGEYEWVTRYDKVSTIADSRAGFLSLAKLFKKPSIEDTNGNLKKREESNRFLPVQSNFTNELKFNSGQTGLESKESRFQDWYSLDPSISPDDGKPLESIFAEIQDTSFPLDFTRTSSVEPGNIDLKLKQKYYSNPIYQNLLALDIDLLLNRQPKEFQLSVNQELDLFTKRRILAAYYDSLRDYSQLPYSFEFENFFDGTKSFANKIYNQQFKGTLRSVCRLFSLTTDAQSNQNNNQMVLKYDQPLYTFSKNPKFSSYHEEINPGRLKNDAEFLTPDRSPNDAKWNTLGNKINIPFLEETFSGPIYAGWDEKLRKFVITNKFLPRTIAGYRTSLNHEIQNKFYKTSLVNEINSLKSNRDNNESQSYKIKFTNGIKNGSIDHIDIINT